jgi:hypothetical protein
MANIIKELRLLLCHWCFEIVLWIAPEDDPEGLIMIASIRDWATKAVSAQMQERMPNGK